MAESLAPEFKSSYEALNTYMEEVDRVEKYYSRGEGEQYLIIKFNRSEQHYLVKGSPHNFYLTPAEPAKPKASTQQDKTSQVLSSNREVKTLVLDVTNFSIRKKEKISDWVAGINPRLQNNPLRYLKVIEKTGGHKALTFDEATFTNQFETQMVTLVLSQLPPERIKGIRFSDDLFQNNTRWFSPLHIAALEGNLRNIQFLLGCGMRVGAKDRDSQTPLHNACLARHSECVKFLLAQGADVNEKNENKSTPLLIAASAGDKECVQAIILRKKPSILYQNENGMNALSLAWNNGFVDIVDIFRKTLNIDSRSDLIGVVVSKKMRQPPRKTPQQQLFRAVEQGNIEQINQLLKSTDITLSAKDELDESSAAEKAFMYSDEKDCFNCFMPYLRKVASEAEKVDVVRRAANRNNQAGLELLLKIPNIPLNTCDSSGETPLHSVCSLGHTNVVKMLVNAGADLTLKTIKGDSEEATEGRNALYIAATHGYLECVKLLIELGMDPFEEENMGCCPIDKARWLGHHQVFAYLEIKMLQLDRVRYFRRVAPEAIAMPEESDKLENPNKGNSATDL